MPDLVTPLKGQSLEEDAGKQCSECGFLQHSGGPNFKKRKKYQLNY